MGSKKTGPEMLGEALRDISILVAVFYTLDAYVGSKPVNLEVTAGVAVGCIICLTLGIVLELVRKRDSSET
jgi:hypothetical protein